MAIMAFMCRPGMVTTPTSCSSQRNSGILSCPRSTLIFAHPCAGLRTNLSLTGRGVGGLKGGLQERVPSSRRRTGRSTTGGGGAVSVRAGLPVVSSLPVVGPLVNAIFNPVLLFIVYTAGAFRFYSGFKRTTYDNSPSTKLSMTALWPVLFLASKAYRNNFKKAVS